MSYQAWIKYFGADTHILERSVRLDDSPYLIVGVMPPDFEFPDSQTAFWKPLVPASVTTGQLMVFPVLARVAPQFSLATASTEVNQVFGHMRGDRPLVGLNSGLRRIEIEPIQEAQSAVSRPALLVLAGAVGFVLLIACANVSNLLLAQLASRQREMATRAALGAGWGRLIRQSLTESILLGCLGGLLGIPVTVAVNRGLLAHWPGNVNAAGMMPKLDHLGVDTSAALFTLSLTIVTGLVLGVAPALHLYRTDYMESLKNGVARAFSGLRIRRSSLGLGALVIVETGLAFVLLIGASLLIRSFLNLSRVDPGFSPQGVLTFQVASPPTTARYVFNAELAARLRALPGVLGAGYGELLPLELDSMLIRPLKVGGTNARMSMQPYSPALSRGAGTTFLRLGCGCFGADGFTRAMGRDSAK